MLFKVENLTKKYGEKIAVDNLSFSIDKPSVLGLLGTNGAGKTTSIRMILNILLKNSGTVTLDGIELERNNNNKIGYLPEERGLYPKTKIIDQLIYFAKLKNMKKIDAIKEIDYWLNRLNVYEYKNMYPTELSKGNQQKIAIIIANLNNPDIIILDEPFSGLDPVNTKLLKDIINEDVKAGKYFIMSSHQMTMVEEFCDNVIILDKGKSVINGNLLEIKNSYPIKEMRVSFKCDPLDFFKNENVEYDEIGKYIYSIKIKAEDEAYKLLNKMLKSKLQILKFELVKPSLNDIFLMVAKED